MDANVTPELAQKVLAADTRNAIKAVGDGGTLPAPHRKLMETIARTPEEAKQARAAALLQKWVEGRDLTDAQRAELHETYPEIVPGPHVDSGDEGLANAAPLDPDGPRVAGRKVVYPERLSVYAATFGLDPESGDRTLKRWIAIGKSATPMDLPPLHRPEKMPAWWAKRMSHRCPEAILLAARRASDALPPAAPVQPEIGPISAQRDFSDLPALGIEGNVEQLRRSLAINERLLEEARSGQIIDGKRVVDEGAVTSRERNYRDTFSELRKAENDLLAWREKNGLVATIIDVRRENNRISSAIFHALLRLVKTVRPQLAGKTDSEQDAVWKHELLECFAALKSSKFADPLSPGDLLKPDELRA